MHIFSAPVLLFGFLARQCFSSTTTNKPYTGPCYDLGTSCPNLARNGICDTFPEACPVSCKLCVSPPGGPTQLPPDYTHVPEDPGKCDGLDHWPNCKELTRRCKYNRMVRNRCQKTCKSC